MFYSAIKHGYMFNFLSKNTDELCQIFVGSTTVDRYIFISKIQKLKYSLAQGPSPLKEKR